MHQNLIFVYGTLRQRGIRQSLMKRHGHFVGHGIVMGQLFDVGEYPAIVLNTSNAQAIVGEVYQLNQGTDALTQLDEYEMCSERFSHTVSTTTQCCHAGRWP